MSDDVSGMEMFSADEAEALLSGRASDAVLGRAFDGLRALATAPAGDAAPLVSAMAAAAVAKGGTLAYWWLLRPRGLLLAKVLLATTATGVAGFGGLAATGTLPTPLQDGVANVAESIGIDLPGGDAGDGAGSPTTVATSSTTSSTTSTTTTTIVSTTTTTVVSAPPSTTTSTTTTASALPRCTSLDAGIISAMALGVQLDPATRGVQLSITVDVTGRVDSAAAHIGGVGEVALVQSEPGVWEKTITISGGPERGGEMILVSILGCGADERSIPISMGGGRG